MAKYAARIESADAAEKLSAFMEGAHDPDEILRTVGWTRSDLKKLETDDEIKGALETRLDALLSTPWRLEARGGEDVTEIAQELEPHIERVIRAAWQAVPLGYSVTEVSWRKEGMNYSIESVIEADISKFRPSNDGRGRLLQKTSTGEYKEADSRFYFLGMRWATKKNPMGEALLSRAYWPWFFRHNVWLFWMRHLERFGDPLLLGSVMSPAEFVESMHALGIENVVAVSPDEKLDAVTKTGADFSAAEEALTRRIQKLILGQTLTTDAKGGGSYAAAKIHNLVRMDKRNADIRLVSPVVQSVLNKLWELNGRAGLAPRFVIEDSTGLQAERAERDATLINAGVSLTRDYFLRAYDYEDGDIEEVSDPQKKNIDASGRIANLSAKPTGERFTKEQMKIEEGVSNLMERTEDPIPPETIRKAVMAAKDEADLADRLAVVLNGDEGSNFRSVLEKAIFAARVFGFATSKSKRIDK